MTAEEGTAGGTDRWYAKPDDLIGGWAVMNVDLTPGEVSDQLPGQRAHMREIANFVTREHAEEIVRLHNASLAGPSPCPNCGAGG